MFNMVMAGLTGLNMLSSNRNAKNQLAMQQQLTQAEIDRNNKIMELYDQGSEEMKNVMSELYGGFGTYDDVSVENFEGMKDYISLARQVEEAENRGEIDTEEARDLKFLFNVESDFRDKSQRYMSQGEGRVSDQDAIFNYNAPSTYDMAQDIDSIAGKFINARMANARGAADRQYSKGAADLARRGLLSDQGDQGMGGGSTLEVELARSAADMEAKALNEAMIAGMDDALRYTKGVQETTAGEQLMNLAERNFGQDLIANASDYSTSQVNNEIAMGGYGLDVYDNYNNARTQAISDLSSIQNLRNDAQFNDYLSALSTMATQSGIFNDYAANQMTMAASPYKFAADGGTNAGFGNALTSAASLSSTLVNNAQSSGTAFGNAIDKLITNKNRGASLK
jgi:hypothetical protein